MTHPLHRYLVDCNPRAIPVPTFLKVGDSEQVLTLYYIEVEPFKPRYFAFLATGQTAKIGTAREVQDFLGCCYNQPTFPHLQQRKTRLSVEDHQAAQSKALKLLFPEVVEKKVYDYWQAILKLKAGSESTFFYDCFTEMNACLQFVDDVGNIPDLYKHLNKTERQSLKHLIRVTSSFLAYLKGETPIEFEDNQLETLDLDWKG